MAQRAQPISPRPGIGAAIVVAALVTMALLAVALRSETGAGLGRADWAAVRFTVLQATLSALLSVLLAIPVARALARRRFWGRSVLITLLGAPFILPVIVAVLGLLTVFGRAGWISTIIGTPIPVYGLHGVVLAHVFFNLPLATRLILQGWQAIPAERFRLAAQLGASSKHIFRLLEMPMLRRVVPSALGVVFAICLTSFAVALTLGGGPKATTVELAIYQAFRFDFDLGRAALLSLIQIALAGAAAVLALGVASDGGFGAGLDRALPQRWDISKPIPRALDVVAITFAALFLILPLLAIVSRGAPALLSLPMPVWRATGISIVVALTSTALLITLALPMAVALAQGARRWVEVAGILGLVASPLVIGTGFFLIINPIADPFALALPVTALINALSALPFALRALVPATRDCLTDYGRLALNLRMGGVPFLRWVLLPRLRAPLGFSAGLGAALSMGDLGVVALFADPDRATLPLQIYRLMGAYRMQDASGAALLLMVLSLLAFWVFDRGGRSHAGS